jgi:tetratricopeptide (TPR) repeat protein
VSKHLSNPDLQLFFDGSSDANLRRKVIRHLLTNCEQCQALAREIGGPLLELPDQASQSISFVLSEENLRRIARRTEQVLFTAVEREKLEAIKTWKAIKGDLGLIRVTDERFLTIAFVALLVNEARVTARDDSRRSLAIVNKAQALLERLPIAGLVKEDLIAHALIVKANASRLAERFEESARYLLQAAEHDCDITTIAYASEISGARLRDVGNFELAVEEMLSAYKVYRDLRDQRKTGSVLVSLADVYKHFNPEHGLKLATDAQAILEGLDEGLERCALAASIDCMTEAGQLDKAATTFQANRKRLLQGGPNHKLKVRWLAARIDRFIFLRSKIQDSYDAAEATYLQLIEEFEAEVMNQEMSLAALQLAQMYHVARKKGKALEQLTGAITSCLKSGVRSDLVQALRMLVIMVQEDRLTDQALASVNNTLTRRWKVKGESANS